jgi:F-type H+-transporting ATPase subunit c
MIRKGMALTALAVLMVLSMAPAAMAQEGSGGGQALLGVGAGLSIGLAALGGGIGQGRTAGSALDGISRNPGVGEDVRPDDPRPRAHRVAVITRF